MLQTQKDDVDALILAIARWNDDGSVASPIEVQDAGKELLLQAKDYSAKIFRFTLKLEKESAKPQLDALRQAGCDAYNGLSWLDTASAADRDSWKGIYYHAAKGFIGDEQVVRRKEIAYELHEVCHETVYNSFQ